MLIKTSIFSGAVAVFFAATSSGRSGDEPSLWKIQQTLAGKRYPARVFAILP
jgi:hypothetical protein